MFWVKTPHEPPRRAEEITPQKQQFASQKLCGSSAEDCVELVNRRSWRLPRAPQKLKLKGQNEGQCLFVCLLTQTGLSNLLTKQNDRRVQKCQVRKRESKTASALLIADSGFDGSTTAQFQAVPLDSFAPSQSQLMWVRWIKSMSLRHIAAVASVFKTGTDWLREKCACLNFRTVTFGAGWQEAKLGDKIATYCNIEMFELFVRRLPCDTLWILGYMGATTDYYSEFYARPFCIFR